PPAALFPRAVHLPFPLYRSARLPRRRAGADLPLHVQLHVSLPRRRQALRSAEDRQVRHDHHGTGGEGLMRVLHAFTVAVTRNGITMFALQRLEGLRKAGVEVDLLSPTAVEPGLRREIEHL